MTTHENHDPVNRWATEHYSFEEDPGDADPQSGTVHAQASGSVPPAPSPPGVAARPRRRMALIVSSVLGLAMIGGIGGVAAAAANADPGNGPRGGPTGDRGAVVQLDRDGGGRTGGPDGGQR